MRWLKSWKTRTLLIFAVVGPGFITANVDNDAGGIYTYSSAGAQFGYGLLWSLIPITLALIVIQEMCARMGAVTGKGLSDLIREEYGIRATFLMMGMLLAINLMNVVAEFIGVATSMGLDRKSTRLNSSHQIISYAVFCLKKKNHQFDRSNIDLLIDAGVFGD